MNVLGQADEIRETVCTFVQSRGMVLAPARQLNRGTGASESLPSIPHSIHTADKGVMRMVTTVPTASLGHGASSSPSSPRDQRRVIAATVVGTTIEWYDFFIYANAAALVFKELFFGPAANGDPVLGQVFSFLTVGISFLFRPLGAVLVGHFGDKLGRKAMLVITLVLMGAATALIGILPTYRDAGMLAPILLITLRVLQGISAGGEWGGAVLMAVEHAPVDKRGRFGMYPQLGVPLGMLLATGTLALMSGFIAPGDAFTEWGWRVPFLLSIVLVIVGFVVRRAVEESPVFQEIAEKGKDAQMPIVALMKRHWKLVILLALIFAGNNAVGYMLTGGYILSYSTNADIWGELAMNRTTVLNCVTVGAVVWGVATLVSGYMSDWIGRKSTYVIGFLCQVLGVFPLFFLVDHGIASGEVIWVLLALGQLAVGLGLTYGPQSAWYAETFPASVRTSGVSISYALGAIVGGAFAPTIATALQSQFHSSMAVGFYLLVMSVVGLAATLVLKDRQGIPLGVEFEESGEYHLFDPRLRDLEAQRRELGHSVP